MFKFKNEKCAVCRYEKCSIFKYKKRAAFKYKICTFFKYRKCISFLQVYKYEKSICNLNQTNLLISDTKNMLISNTNVTFKYERYLFLERAARHINYI